MRKNGKKNISYAIAAGVLLSSVSMTSLASPVAGVVGMASTDSATVASNSYSTLSGVSLTLANILSDASAAADNTSDVASNNTTTVEQQAPESEYANVAIAQVDNYVVPQARTEMLLVNYTTSQQRQYLQQRETGIRLHLVTALVMLNVNL